MKHHYIELCMDTMYVAECGMLTAMDWTVKYHSLVPIVTRMFQYDYYNMYLPCPRSGQGKCMCSFHFAVSGQVLDSHK